MKRCPDCGRTYHTLTHCLNDGAALVQDVPETTSFFYFPADSRDYSEEIPLADFKEAPTAPAYPETPTSKAPPLAIPTGTAPAATPYYAARTRRTRRMWPGVVLLGILGLFGLSVGGLELLRHGLQEAALKEDSSAESVPVTAADTMPDLFPGLKLDSTLTQTASGTLRQSLITAVKGADAAEAASLQTLDPAPLHQFYAGPALAAGLDEMRSLKQAGTREESRLTARRFKDFQVNPDHTKAQGDVDETWDTVTRSRASGRVVRKDMADSTSQIVSLTHTPHGWVLENVQFYKIQ